MIKNMTEFYLRVRFFSKQKKIPVSRIEEQIGVCNGYLRKLKIPDYYTIRRVAKVFGLTTDEFMETHVGDVQTIKQITVYETDFKPDEWKLVLRLVAQAEKESK